MKIDAILSPAELPAFAQRDLSETVCVVFDVLRATSTFVTALHNGAKAIIPVSEISEALAIRKKRPDVLLGGERDGIKIRAAQTGDIDFDLGNSPREYTSEKVHGKTIVSTTTNGTRALRACAGAKMILAASFLNLTATAKFIRQIQPAQIVLVCAGTRENMADEDVLAAGALCELLEAEPSNLAEITRRVYTRAKINLAAAVRTSENARRLLAIPELRDDVPFCLQRDVIDLTAALGRDGAIRALV
jgi:2-phosphosulfolactate phosphatase